MFDLWSVYKTELNNTTLVGLDVSNPAVIKTAENSDVQSVLTEVSANLDDILDRQQTMTLMNSIMSKYRGKPRIVTFINSLKNNLYQLAQ